MWRGVALLLASLHAAAAIASFSTPKPASPLPRAAVDALESVRSKGFAVVPDLLSADQVRLIKQDVARLQSEGRFSVAGVGEAATNRVADDVRRCEQCFIYPRIKHGGGGEQAGRELVYSLLDGVKEAMERTCATPLDGLLTEGLYASYPRGGYYRRHTDSATGTAQSLRRFSYLLYCNQAWQESDGGCLRIHLDGGGEVAPAGVAPSFVDVPPRAGTLCVFRSDMPHEVLETDAPRLAIVGWLNAPPEGSSERRALIAKLGGALVLGGAVKIGLALGGSD